MKNKNILKIVIALVISIIPSVIYAADLDIICNENNSPTIKKARTARAFFMVSINNQ